MNVFECIVGRRSIRKFERKEVDDRIIGVLLYMATYAPSAGNVQDWHFVVVKDEEKKAKLARAALDQDFIKEAPVVIVVCSDLKKISLRYGDRGEKLYSIQDTAAAIQNLLLSAHAFGLGTCWVGAFDEEEVRFALELPENLRPLAVIPIGFPAEKPEAPSRIPFERVTHLDRYGGKIEFKFKTLEEYLRNFLKKLKERKEKKEVKEVGFKEIIKRLIQ